MSGSGLATQTRRLFILKNIHNLEHSNEKLNKCVTPRIFTFLLFSKTPIISSGRYRCYYFSSHEAIFISCFASANFSGKDLNWLHLSFRCNNFITVWFLDLQIFHRFRIARCGKRTRVHQSYYGHPLQRLWTSIVPQFDDTPTLSSCSLLCRLRFLRNPARRICIPKTKYAYMVCVSLAIWRIASGSSWLELV